MFSPNRNRLEFHYNQVIRPDLLLKINYENIMEVPRLCKIIVVPKAPSNFIKNVKLAMEIVCGQKFIQTRSRGSFPNSTYTKEKIYELITDYHDGRQELSSKSIFYLTSAS
ncbi:hypothetical protein MPTK1_2g12110 [Marchantia polymorpha subsp. ruderalis]